MFWRNTNPSKLGSWPLFGSVISLRISLKQWTFFFKNAPIWHTVMVICLTIEQILRNALMILSLCKHLLSVLIQIQMAITSLADIILWNHPYAHFNTISRKSVFWKPICGPLKTSVKNTYFHLVSISKLFKSLFKFKYGQLHALPWKHAHLHLKKEYPEAKKWCYC